MEYDIKNDWLYNNDERITAVPCGYEKYSSGRNICDYIVMHYTGGTTAQSAHNTYQTPNRQVSWHLTIARDGTVYQLLDFRKRAWHAGRSGWWKPSGTPITGMNKWSIGIEMISAGPLTLKNGGYYTWFNKRVPCEEVYLDFNGKAWHNFTAAQIRTAKELVPALCKEYKCVDVLAHEEISPGRKIDTGRAFDATLKELKEICKTINK